VARSCEEEVGIVDRHPLGECFCELDDDAVAVAEHRRVRSAFELVAYGVVELGHVVTDRVHPQRRDGIEVAVPVDVDELMPLGTLHEDR